MLNQLIEQMRVDIATTETSEFEHNKTLNQLSPAKDHKIPEGPRDHKRQSVEAKETEN